MEQGRIINVKNADVTMAFINKFRNQLRGSTLTRQLYKKVIKAHVAVYIRDPVNIKRFNSVIVTDGEPSDLGNPSMT